MFVATNICCDKSFVVTKIFCHDKHNCFHNQTFVTTSILLLRQKMCFVATNTCLLRQFFAMTKMIFVAARANDNRQWYEVPASLTSCSLYHTVTYLSTLIMNNSFKHSEFQSQNPKRMLRRHLLQETRIRHSPQSQNVTEYHTAQPTEIFFFLPGMYSMEGGRSDSFSSIMTESPTVTTDDSTPGTHCRVCRAMAKDDGMLSLSTELLVPDRSCVVAYLEYLCCASHDASSSPNSIFICWQSMCGTVLFDTSCCSSSHTKSSMTYVSSDVGHISFSGAQGVLSCTHSYCCLNHKHQDSWFFISRTLVNPKGSWILISRQQPRVTSGHKRRYRITSESLIRHQHYRSLNT